MDSLSHSHLLPYLNLPSHLATSHHVVSPVLLINQQTFYCKLNLLLLFCFEYVFHVYKYHLFLRFRRQLCNLPEQDFIGDNPLLDKDLFRQSVNLLKSC